MSDKEQRRKEGEVNWEEEKEKKAYASKTC